MNAGSSNFNYFVGLVCVCGFRDDNLLLRAGNEPVRWDSALPACQKRVNFDRSGRALFRSIDITPLSRCRR